MKNNNANRMILDDMKAKILRGEYPVGSKLPSERELSEYYNVSRIPAQLTAAKLFD
jgi:GntR family uxuAB operon transcriptional repressor